MESRGSRRLSARRHERHLGLDRDLAADQRAAGEGAAAGLERRSTSTSSRSTSPGSDLAAELDRRQRGKRRRGAGTAPAAWAISSVAACASASTISTPGITGKRGKCPWKYGSLTVTFLSARIDLPGSIESTRSTSRHGYRCGSRARIAAMVISGPLARHVMAPSSSAAVPAAPAARSSARTRRAEPIQPAQLRRDPAPLGMRKRRETLPCSRPGVVIDATISVRPRNHRAVGDVDVPDDHRRAADPAVAADRRAAGDADAARDRRVAPDAAVVADLDLVVELDVVLDDRVVERAAVDRRVGADLAVGADDDAADLRDPEPAAVLLGHAEAVGADHRAAVHHRPRADDAAVVDGDVGVQDRAGAPMDTLAPITDPAPTRALGPTIAPAPTTARGPIDALGADLRRRARRPRRVDARAATGAGCSSAATCA